MKNCGSLYVEFEYFESKKIIDLSMHVPNLEWIYHDIASKYRILAKNRSESQEILSDKYGVSTGILQMFRHTTTLTSMIVFPYVFAQNMEEMLRYWIGDRQKNRPTLRNILVPNGQHPTLLATNRGNDESWGNAGNDITWHDMREI